MSNPNYTAVLFILDVSGSMSGFENKLEAALHLMLEQQARKLAGYITVDVGYFDDSHYQGIQGADPLTVNLELFSAGGTQLYDSAAVLINTFEKRLDAMPQDAQPGHVVVIIVTDGDSSQARTLGGRNISSKISSLRNDKGWDFAFLGADRHSFDQVRATLGLPEEAGVYHPLTPRGIEKAAEDLGRFISMSRSGERATF